MRRVGRVVGALGAVLVGQTVWARFRRLPTFEDLDPNGWEGPDQGRPLRIVVIGDSSVTGAGLTRPDDIWVRVLARRLAESGRRVEVVSFAVGGSTAQDIVTGQLEAAISAAGDVAIVSVGGNDALRGVSLRTFERALDTIVVRLLQVTPIVALSGVGDIGAVPRIPRPLADLARRRGRALHAIHGRVAARHGVLVAAHPRWVAEAFQDREMFAADLFHPSAAGHVVWAEMAFELLSGALTDRADA